MGTKMRHFEKDDHLRMNEDQSRFWRGGGTKSVTVGDTQLKMISTRSKKNNLGSCLYILQNSFFKLICQNCF